MKVISVRLNADDARKVAVLRKDGVSISSLFREAIRAEYNLRRKPKRNTRKPSEIIEELMARYPTPPDTPRRNYNVHNRHEARAAIIRKLRGDQS
jgi:hypothetical protein